MTINNNRVLKDVEMTFDFILADPPWWYYGAKNKDAAAGKHYDLLKNDELAKLPISNLLKKEGALFLWATCPRLDRAIDLIERWGLHYRGVAYVWVKTRKDGAIIHGQGVPPTFTKPTTELVLAASNQKRGRPLDIKDLAQGQVVLAPRGRHSQKPEEVYNRIENLFGPNIDKLELFARRPREDYVSWGKDIGDPLGIGFEPNGWHTKEDE